MMSFTNPFLKAIQSVLLMFFALLVSQTLKGQDILISEFMAMNQSGLEDVDGDFSDWIELYNTRQVPVDVTGWFLTDDPTRLDKWQLPEWALPPGGFQVVFASGKDRSDPELHTSFRLDAAGEFLALVRSDRTTIEHAYMPGYPEQREGFSYGLLEVDSTLEARFFESPTPGRANISGHSGFVADTKFSVNRGFFSEPFLLEITTETEGAVIRYTTDFSTPTESHGTIYSRPIEITTTTIVRAMAFKPGYQATNVDTHSYLFLSDVIRQPPRHIGWPSTWKNGNGTVPADYEMDPEVTEDPRYAGEMLQALLDIPSISIVTDMGNLFGNTGIYDNPLQSGINWERPASVEWILPDNSKGFQVNSGLRIQGGASREPLKSPKHSFRLLFKSQYGPSKLRYRLFPEKTASAEFDTIILRAGFNQSWIHHNNFLGDNRGRAQYVRDQWAKDTQQAMGTPATHNNYAHLYLNGLYWGLYNPTERPSDSFASAYFGGDKSEYDVINSGEPVDGNLNAWNQMFNLANGGLADPDRYRQMEEILDLDAFIDFMIINHYGGNMDWDSHNWYAFRRRAPGGKFYFFMWDSEFIFIDLNDNRINLNDDRRPGRLFSRLKENADFRIKVADHIQKHFFNSGLLTPEKVIERWDKRSDTILNAILGESARWGDYRRDVLRAGGPFDLLTRDNQWLTERARLMRAYFPSRTAVVLNQYQSQGWFPNTAAPLFDTPSGRVSSGALLSMQSEEGVIYFTTDGSDPRLPTSQAVSRKALVSEGDSKRVLVPSSATESPAQNQWTGGSADFDDGAWMQAAGGVGYDTALDYLPFIETNVDREMRGQNTSVYMRIPFQIDSLEALDILALKVRYDDGFAAFINGTFIASANAPNNLAWNSSATSSHSDSAAVQFQSFDASAALPHLKVGTNILAIHGLNQSLTSSDFLISATLEAEKINPASIHPSARRYASPVELVQLNTVNARTLKDGEWSALQSVRYAVGMDDLRLTEVHYHPAGPDAEEESSGFSNPDDFEFIEIYNRSDQPIDLTGLRLIDGVGFDFTSARIRSLEPKGLAILVSRLEAFEKRYGTGLPIAGEYVGNLANQGERLAAVDINGQLVFELEYSDKAPWPVEADGQGLSLEWIQGSENPASPLSWRSSLNRHGTPGNHAAFEVRIQRVQLNDGSLHLTFLGIPNATYTVFRSESLSHPNWIQAGSGRFDSQDGTAELFEGVSLDTGGKYYKVSSDHFPMDL